MTWGETTTKYIQTSGFKYLNFGNISARPKKSLTFSLKLDQCVQYVCFCVSRTVSGTHSWLLWPCYHCDSLVACRVISVCPACHDGPAAVCTVHCVAKRLSHSFPVLLILSKCGSTLTGTYQGLNWRKNTSFKDILERSFTLLVKVKTNAEFFRNSCLVHTQAHTHALIHKTNSSHYYLAHPTGYCLAWHL